MNLNVLFILVFAAVVILAASRLVSLSSDRDTKGVLMIGVAVTAAAFAVLGFLTESYSDFVEHLMLKKLNSLIFAVYILGLPLVIYGTVGVMFRIFRDRRRAN